VHFNNPLRGALSSRFPTEESQLLGSYRRTQPGPGITYPLPKETPHRSDPSGVTVSPLIMSAQRSCATQIERITGP
jgi:hypothetical protein